MGLGAENILGQAGYGAAVPPNIFLSAVPEEPTGHGWQLGGGGNFDGNGRSTGQAGKLRAVAVLPQGFRRGNSKRNLCRKKRPHPQGYGRLVRG